MVANGVTRARLPAGNDALCTLDDPQRAGARAAEMGNDPLGRRDGALARAPRRLRSSSSAMRRPRCSTCSNMLDAGAPKPAAGDRHPRRLRRRGRIEAGALAAGRGGAFRHRAWPARRLGHGGRGRQCAGAATRNESGERDRRDPALRRWPRPGRPGADDRAGARSCPRRARPVWCYFCKQGRRGNARTIGRRHHRARSRPRDRAGLPGDDRGRGRRPPTTGRLPRFYDDGAPSASLTEMAAGRTLAVRRDGDPFFYGSFMHLSGALSHRFPETEVVPGVTGVAGAGARRARRSPGATT